MGIEPTSDALTPLNGFEDRGGHQTSKLFPVLKTSFNSKFRNGFPSCSDPVCTTGTVSGPCRIVASLAVSPCREDSDLPKVEEILAGVQRKARKKAKKSKLATSPKSDNDFPLSPHNSGKCRSRSCQSASEEMLHVAGAYRELQNVVTDSRSSSTRNPIRSRCQMISWIGSIPWSTRYRGTPLRSNTRVPFRSRSTL